MARFKAGDWVTVRSDPTLYTLFHTRTPMYTRGRTGQIVQLRPEWMVPEDEAWGREDGRFETFYVLRFREAELWPDYQGEPQDTLQIEINESWLELAKGAVA